MQSEFWLKPVCSDGVAEAVDVVFSWKVSIAALSPGAALLAEGAPNTQYPKQQCQADFCDVDDRFDLYPGRGDPDHRHGPALRPPATASTRSTPAVIVVGAFATTKPESAGTLPSHGSDDEVVADLYWLREDCAWCGFTEDSR